MKLYKNVFYLLFIALFAGGFNYIFSQIKPTIQSTSTIEYFFPTGLKLFIFSQDNTVNSNWLKAIFNNIKQSGVTFNLSDEDSVKNMATMIWSSPTFQKDLNGFLMGSNTELRQRLWESLLRGIDEVNRQTISETIKQKKREEYKPSIQAPKKSIAKKPSAIAKPAPQPRRSTPIRKPSRKKPIAQPKKSAQARQPSRQKPAAKPIKTTPTPQTPDLQPVANKEEFNILKANYENFDNNIGTFPTKANTITAVAGNDPIKQAKIVSFAKATHPVVDSRVLTLCKNFISFKKTNGSAIEKVLYKNMSLPLFIIRLFEKRPLMFMTEQDVTLLRGQNQFGKPMDWTKVGTEQETSPLLLKDYLSYDEMKVAALIGLSNPTYFINDGNRNNKAVVGTPGTFEEEGIYTGIVGTRFEKPNFMEWQDIIITQQQNTESNGYGLNGNKGLVKIWSTLYGMQFPTYQEAAADTSGNYIQCSKGYFNMPAFKKRLELVIKPFLLDANTRAKNNNKKAYVHMVGLGLGAWAITDIIKDQTRAIVEVYKDLIQKNSFSSIADIDFSWFGDVSVPNMSDGNAIKDKGNNAIMIHFSKRNPADKLTGNNAGKLLVACYAWDGNAFPGNEYWGNYLSASGDPAAACCSLITALQNIWINTWLKDTIMRLYGSRR